MEEKILVLGEGKRGIEYLSELEEVCLTRSALANVVRDDPGTLSVLLRTARAGGCSYDELINKVGDIGAVNKGLDKLLDVGILTAKWEFNKEENTYERKFFNRGEIAKNFEDFSEALDRGILDRQKLLKRLLLLDIK
ncbi:MAG: hypothetical protein KAT65_24785 [Methanophagales archaeon]|nr:hypothetical protein [Methanophagales archaeon]